MKYILGTMSADKGKIFKDFILSRNNNKEIIFTQHSASSHIANQPFSRGETILGAMNRAYEAYSSSNETRDTIGIGLEGGLVSRDGKAYLLCIAATYDGTDFKIGESELVPLPDTVSDKVHSGAEFGIEIREYAEKNKKDPLIEELISRKKSFTSALENAL